MVFAAKEKQGKGNKNNKLFDLQTRQKRLFQQNKKTLLKRFLRSHHVTVKGHGLISDWKNYQTSKILLAFVSIKQP